jgi:hypothetical protein
MLTMIDEKRPVWDPDGIVPDGHHRSVEWTLENHFPDRSHECRAIAYTQLLWSGWEFDTGIVLIEIDGERKTVIVSGVANASETHEEMLRERLDAYREAIASTQAFLANLAKLEGRDD